MSTFKKINLHWGSIMDFLITKFELFLISTNLGYNGEKKNKNKNVCSIHLFIFFSESSFECVSCRNIMSAFLLPHQVNTVLL